MPFNVGDVVQLKSGGPLMTVTSVGNAVACAWFDGMTPKSDVFPAGSLKLATQGQGPLRR